MSEDLNIRAAKVLGWEIKYHYTELKRRMWYPINSHKKSVLSGNYEHCCFNDEGLLFTKSQNWAYLGLRLIKKHGKTKVFKEKLVGIVGGLYFAKPYEITQAWVEVLEKIESEKNENR